MEIPEFIINKWGKKFPNLNSEWTHWLIIGDGGPITILSGDELKTAIQVIIKSFGRYKSIEAIRVKVDKNLNITEEEKASSEISNLFNDKIRIEERNG